MTADAARAGAGWLALREPADAAARSAALVAAVQRLLPDGDLVVHDLGCGTGSMARWLAPQLPGRQRWVLHDRDGDLLARAATMPRLRAADGAPVEVGTCLDDVTRLAPHELTGTSLVTASALLDMLTQAELERLVAGCAAPGCCVLLTLSVVGQVDLSPADPLDDRLMAAFNAHQRRVRDQDPLLGPDAAARAVAAFERLGREVVVRPSPWRLGAEHTELVTAWLDGWLGAACEQAPELARAAGSYRDRRVTAARDGSLTVVVHHRDLLVLPVPR